jgi:hypothetical protein
MDGSSNPFLSTIWLQNNNTSDKIYSDAGLRPPVVNANGEETFVSSSLLVTSGEMKLNAGSNLLPSTVPVGGVSGCELTDLPLPPLAGSELFSSNPAIWAPSSFANSDVSSFKVGTALLALRITNQFGTKAELWCLKIQ